MLRLLAPLLVYVAVATAGVTASDSDAVTKVSVKFYGESQCPYCRKFVEETWNEIWSDQELRTYLDYDFVPWGNAYFATTMCGQGPYDSNERACFYNHCITATTPDEDACFGGEPIYQHSLKEGEIDIYETCILQDVGLEEAVDFTYCAEGSIMDYTDMSSEDLLKKCAPSGVDPAKIQECLEKRGRQLEIANAKKTPVHPGVPYVVVDGLPLENPLEAKKSICDKLQELGAHPKACTSDMMSSGGALVGLQTSY